MKKIVLFDFDGTIADTFNLAVSVYNELAPKYGAKLIEEGERNSIRAKSAKELFRLSGLSLLKLPGFLLSVKKLIKNKIKSTPLIPGMKQVLEELNKSGYEISILSSNSKENISIFLKSNNLDHLFKEILVSDNIFGKEKSIKNFLKTRNISKSSIVYIGDEVRDIEAAKKVGIPVVAVTWGFNNEESLSLSAPNILVHSAKNLPSAISSLLQA